MPDHVKVDPHKRQKILCTVDTVQIEIAEVKLATSGNILVQNHEKRFKFVGIDGN